MRFASKSHPILVFIGPSGSGKSTIANYLLHKGIVGLSPTYTTRPKRIEDADDPTHIFVTEKRFDQLEAAHKFLQTERLFGLPYRYGFARIPEPAPGRVPLVMLRAQLIQYLPHFYTNFQVYQIEASMETITKRLTRRSVSAKRDGTRQQNIEQEISVGRPLANRVFVNERDIPSVCDQIATAIREDFD